MLMTCIHWYSLFMVLALSLGCFRGLLCHSQEMSPLLRFSVTSGPVRITDAIANMFAAPVPVLCLIMDNDNVGYPESPWWFIYCEATIKSLWSLASRWSYNLIRSDIDMRQSVSSWHGWLVTVDTHWTHVRKCWSHRFTCVVKDRYHTMHAGILGYVLYDTFYIEGIPIKDIGGLPSWSHFISRLVLLLKLPSC